MQEKLTQVTHLKSLTSLRFFAAMMIVIVHTKSGLDWPWTRSAPPTLMHGVSFFFVLSGFILTHVYSGKPLPPYSTFIRARVARLWPVHATAILLLAWAVRADSVTFDGPGIFNKWVVLGVNLSLLHAIVPTLSYSFSWNAVSWSISTELFFYLAFPLLVINIENTWKKKLFGSAILAFSLILILWLSGVNKTSTDINAVTAMHATYPSPLMRGFEFCLGMATWAIWKQKISRWNVAAFWWTVAELAIIIFLIVWLQMAAMRFLTFVDNSWINFFLSPASSCWLFSIIIAIFASGQGIISKIISIRPLVFLGEISFSIYMFHQILMKIFRLTLNWSNVPEIIYFGTLFCLSATSYLLIEKPGQRLLSRKIAKPVLGVENEGLYNSR